MPSSAPGGGLRITGLTGIFHKEDWPLPTTGQLSLCSGEKHYFGDLLNSPFFVSHSLRGYGYFVLQQDKIIFFIGILDCHFTL